MKQVFADTFYWVALAHPRDHWHERATTLSKSLGQVQIVTTDEVLTHDKHFSQEGFRALFRD